MNLLLLFSWHNKQIVLN